MSKGKPRQKQVYKCESLGDRVRQLNTEKSSSQMLLRCIKLGYEMACAISFVSEKWPHAYMPSKAYARHDNPTFGKECRLNKARKAHSQARAHLQDFRLLFAGVLLYSTHGKRP
jgi:hypothetical protein